MKEVHRTAIYALILLFLMPGGRLALADEKLKTEYVVLVTIDGLRNEELFGGADPKLLNNSKRSGAENQS